MVIWIKFAQSLIPKMTFTLAISSLKTSSLPWFRDLTLQVPMQYCSLLPSPVTTAGGCCFCFGSISSFFLELFIHSTPVAYWEPINLGSSSFSVLSFHLFILFMRFSRQEYWRGLPFPSPVDHILSELSTMTHLSWMTLHSMAHCFIETRLWSMWSAWLALCDCGFHSVCPLMNQDKRFMEASWWQRLTVGETRSCSNGQGHAQ